MMMIAEQHVFFDGYKYYFPYRAFPMPPPLVPILASLLHLTR